MGSGETLPFRTFARATSGQVVWVYLNKIIDNDERRDRTHRHCRAKLDDTICEVCYKPLTGEDIIGMDAEELEQLRYKPGEDFLALPDIALEGDMSERRKEIADLFATEE